LQIGATHRESKGAIVGRNVPGPFREGPFALQVHGGQEVEVRFKTIELLDEGASK